MFATSWIKRLRTEIFRCQLFKLINTTPLALSDKTYSDQYQMNDSTINIFQSTYQSNLKRQVCSLLWDPHSALFSDKQPLVPIGEN